VAVLVADADAVVDADVEAGAVDVEIVVERREEEMIMPLHALTAL
jgi:hypothetical protein